MAKRMILMLAAVTALLVALGAFKYQQVQGAIAAASSYQPPPEAVTTVVASSERWPSALDAIATVRAVDGVIVSADLPGIVERIAFDSGTTVEAGEVLIELDAKQEEAQLEAAVAQRDLARLQLDRLRGLWEEGIVSRSQYDGAIATHTEAEARVGEIQATLARKVIRAPFAGALGIRQVNLGQYLSGGSPIVPLESVHPIHVDFAVPQQEIARLRRGLPVRVTTPGGSGIERKGRLTAFDSIIDEGTRNARIQATFDNRDGALRPGMFVEAQVLLGAGDPVVALPASAISYAPYGDSVFVVAEMTGPDGRSYRGVRQQFVALGAARGDQIAVLSGVEPGDEVVTSGVFRLRSGVAVHVDNDLQPTNDPAPAPENS